MCLFCNDIFIDLYRTHVKYRNTIQYIIQLNLYKVLHYRNIHIKYKKKQRVFIRG